MNNFKSDSIVKLTEAVICVMEEVKGMEKNSRVGAGNSAYDGTKDSDVKEVFNRVLSENKLAIMPIDVQESTQIDRWEEEDSWSKSVPKAMKTKQSVFTKVTTKYLLSHTSGEWVVLAGFGQGIDPQDKGAGKATTYAMKNMLLYTFVTPVGKIDDTDLTHSADISTPSNTTGNQPTKHVKAEAEGKPKLIKDSEEWNTVLDRIHGKHISNLDTLAHLDISDVLKKELEDEIESIKIELKIDSEEWKALLGFYADGKLTRVSQVTKKFKMDDKVLQEITKIIETPATKKEEAPKEKVETKTKVEDKPKTTETKKTRLPALSDEDYEGAKKKTKIEILKILGEHRTTPSRRKELTELANKKA